MSDKKYPVAINYEVDLKCVPVEAVGYIVRPLTGGFDVALEGALLRDKNGGVVNVIDRLSEDTLSGMRTNIKSRYFSSVMPSLMRDGCADEGAPA